MLYSILQFRSALGNRYIDRLQTVVYLLRLRVARFVERDLDVVESVGDLFVAPDNVLVGGRDQVLELFLKLAELGFIRFAAEHFERLDRLGVALYYLSVVDVSFRFRLFMKTAHIFTLSFNYH